MSELDSAKQKLFNSASKKNYPKNVEARKKIMDEFIFSLKMSKSFALEIIDNFNTIHRNAGAEEMRYNVSAKFQKIIDLFKTEMNFAFELPNIEHRKQAVGIMMDGLRLIIDELFMLLNLIKLETQYIVDYIPQHLAKLQECKKTKDLLIKRLLELQEENEDLKSQLKITEAISETQQNQIDALTMMVGDQDRSTVEDATKDEAEVSQDSLDDLSRAVEWFKEKVDNDMNKVQIDANVLVEVQPEV